MHTFIDTHTHISDEAFMADREECIARATASGVKAMLLPDIDSSERDDMLAVCDAHPGLLYPMAGLYPGSVDACWKNEIELLEDILSVRKFVAIGEIGLDYHFSTEYSKEQKKVLRLQFEMAAKLDLPVNIHLRDATEDFFKVLEDCKSLGLRGNLHAFSGSYETFLRVQRYGDWSIGIGGVVTFKNAGLADVVRKVPLERILLETDAPYLTPSPHRGTRNESAYLPIIASKVAELKSTNLDEVSYVTSMNAAKLFGLDTTYSI